MIARACVQAAPWSCWMPRRWRTAARPSPSPPSRWRASARSRSRARARWRSSSWTRWVQQAAADGGRGGARCRKALLRATAAAAAAAHMHNRVERGPVWSCRTRWSARTRRASRCGCLCRWAIACLTRRRLQPPRGSGRRRRPRAVRATIHHSSRAPAPPALTQRARICALPRPLRPSHLRPTICSYNWPRVRCVLLQVRALRQMTRASLKPSRQQVRAAAQRNDWAGWLHACNYCVVTAFARRNLCHLRLFMPRAHALVYWLHPCRRRPRRSGACADLVCCWRRRRRHGRRRRRLPVASGPIPGPPRPFCD